MSGGNALVGATGAVMSTAFGPYDRNELMLNLFRVVTSMPVPQDRSFFNADLAVASFAARVVTVTGAGRPRQ